MHFSIAPTEISTQMTHQFTDPKRQPAPRSGMRRRVSVMLFSLANRLEPTPGR